MCNCRQTDFFKNVFSFFHFFKHPLFRAANLSKIMLSLVRGATFRSLTPILGPLWGGLRERFYEQNLCFTKGI